MSFIGVKKCWVWYNDESKILSLCIYRCVLDLLSTSVALVSMTILLFVYLEYLTEDSDKIKIFKKLRYKIVDAFFRNISILLFIFYYCIGVSITNNNEIV